MREGGIPATYAALDEMLDRERPDGVIVCPTFDQIFPVAKALAPRRIPALLEKPTGMSLAEFNELCRLVAEYRAPQMVGLNRRHYSVVNRAVADAGGPAAVRAVMIDWSEDPAHLRRKGFSRRANLALGVQQFDPRARSADLSGRQRGEPADSGDAWRLGRSTGT